MLDKSKELVKLLIFFFEQKTAYDILTCDWSSDVCSSDLHKHLSSSTFNCVPIPILNYDPQFLYSLGFKSIHKETNQSNNLVGYSKELELLGYSSD